MIMDCILCLFPLVSLFLSLSLSGYGLSMSLCLQEHLIENEVAVLRRVKHPNIIMLMEEVDSPTELCLVMELVKVTVTLCLWTCYMFILRLN